MYNPELLDKPRMIAITKSDLIDDELKSLFEKELPKKIPHIFISAVTNNGLVELKDKLWKMLTH
jgi:GTP-binding protein